MTAEDYWAAIRHLGLRPSNVGTVYLDANGTPDHVQNPDPLPPQVRLALIQKLRALMGVGQANR
jgi:hypothetical protein